ncbi:hypothetical protein DIE18_03305 [Burkholderia sp. Bp9125]|nr:hypothetical protein DIE18_03305 [Burkholderia sp. Bp9125]
MSQKRIMPRDQVVRVSWKPDYDHDAWMNNTTDVPPTRDTHPDAFYRVTECVSPPCTPASTRQQPPARLSRTKLRRRLYRAGYSGAELNRLATLVARGPILGAGVEAFAASSTLLLGWPKAQLEATLGRDLARRLTRFVRAQFIMLDEFGSYTPPAFSAFYARMHRQFVPQEPAAEVSPALPVET